MDVEQIVKFLEAERDFLTHEVCRVGGYSSDKNFYYITGKLDVIRDLLKQINPPTNLFITPTTSNKLDIK